MGDKVSCWEGKMVVGGPRGTHSSSSTAGWGCGASRLLLLLLLLIVPLGCCKAATARRARILQARQHGALFVGWKRAMRGRALG